MDEDAGLAHSCAAPDGGYHRPVAGGPLVFVRTPAPGRDELAQMVVKIQRRVQRLLKHRGLSPEDRDDDGVESEGGVLGQLQAAALTGRVEVGERAGQRVVRVGGAGGGRAGDLAGALRQDLVSARL